jgi:hypothetical protein
MSTVLSGYGFEETSGPYLVLDDLGPEGPTRRRWSVRGRELTVTASEVHQCAGYFDLITYESFPCPEQSPIGPDVETCFKCFRRTGFFPSFYHVAVDTLSPQQRAYNERPHVVYLAYFAEGCIKVGISTQDRVFLRWRGQGARLATRLLSVADAYEARSIEERVVRLTGLPEVVRSARKRAFLNEPFDPLRARQTLEETRKRVEQMCHLEPTPFSAHDFTADYLGAHRLDLPVTDLTEERPLSISGLGVGLIGDVLVVEESGRQFILSVKELIGRVVEIDGTARRNSKRPAAGQLGFGFS